jgi:hypothetical protein
MNLIEWQTKTEVTEEDAAECRFAHYEIHLDFSGTEFRPPLLETR